jgi:hypothetical protein
MEAQKAERVTSGRIMSKRIRSLSYCLFINYFDAKIKQTTAGIGDSVPATADRYEMLAGLQVSYARASGSFPVLGIIRYLITLIQFLNGSRLFDRGLPQIIP